MNDENAERARRFVDAAKTDTVTEKLLVGGDEYTGEFFLYGDPPIERLQGGERPQSILFNDMKGVGIGSKRDTVTPDGGARSLFVVTNDRVLLLVGQQDGDWVRSIPFADVTGVDYNTGFMKHRMIVDTSDSQYHLWIDASYEEAALEATAALIEAGGGGPSTDAHGSATTGTQVGDGSGDVSTVPDDVPRSNTTVGGSDGAGIERGSGGDSDEDDPLETLERLKELHDKGVLTDREFEAKKSDVLDQI